jgi:hypothetical protein
MIIDHEIILRDSSRFHHFKKGSCSCRGYWWCWNYRCTVNFFPFWELQEVFR